MICDGCDHEALVLKTVRSRTDPERVGALCNDCWIPLAHRVLVIPGPVACFGRCRGCAGWFSVNDLRDPKPGRKDAWSGTCPSCSR